MTVSKFSLYSLYGSISVYIFLKVFETSELIIDEEFHLRQGMHYCNAEFEIWDPKITTFPGLYIVSTIFLLPFNICSTFALRSISLVASFVNVWLIYEIRKLVTGRYQKNDWKLSFETLTIAILPPMYFFAHLYYTDVLSMTTVLGLILFNMKNEHNIAAVFGLASVIMRQTNIVWVGMALGTTVIDKFVSQTMPFIKDKTTKIDQIYTFEDIFLVLGFYFKRIYLIPKQIALLARFLIGYLLVLLMFIVFVYVNGSIVIGDKSAHEAALHLPQLFYFSIFTSVFGVSLVLANLKETLKCLWQRWYLVVLGCILLAVIVNFNTLVHPYLLADNRHYTFYIWNKFYGRFSAARFVIIPLYLFSFTSMYKSVEKNKSAGFRLIYVICAFGAIAFQKLLEIRYFLIPFMLIRLNSRQTKVKYLVLEFAIHLLINSVVFYQFFTKEILWSDFDNVQRLIW